MALSRGNVPRPRNRPRSDDSYSDILHSVVPPLLSCDASVGLGCSLRPRREQVGRALPCARPDELECVQGGVALVKAERDGLAREGGDVGAAVPRQGVTKLISGEGVTSFG